MRRPALRVLCALGAALSCVAAPSHALAAGATAAAGIADPTTPAPGYGPPGSATDPKHAADPGANRPADADRLQMILVQGDKRSAIVGGRTMHVGDTLEIEGSPARIERIDEGALVLQQGGSRKVLHLIDGSAAVRRKPDCSNKPTGASACRTP